MRSALILLAGATVGCASGEPGPPTQTEIREDLIVQVLDGDFVRFGGARRPLDAVVLELRQLVRSRSDEELGAMRVTIEVQDGAPREAGLACDRLWDQLQIMGVRWARIE
jgi:hypothetical protein